MNEIYINLVEHLGDIIACEPVSKFLRTKNPDKKIYWVLNKKYKDVVIANPYINGIIEVDNLAEADSFLQKKREEGSTILDLHYDGRTCSSTGKIHKNNIKSGINEANVFLNNSSILQSFSLVAGLEPLNEAPTFHLKENLELPSKIPTEYIVFHCKSNSKDKDWSPQKWNKLADRILKTNVKIVEIGLEQVVKSNNPNYINCTDIHDIQTIALIIKNAKCFVGVDSAFAHIANCFNKYAILIFGKLGNFKEYNPYSGNYGKLQNCTLIYVKDFSKCIPVSIVYREFENFIKNKTKKLNKRKHCYRISAKTFLRKIFSLQNELDKDSNKIKVITICAIQIKVKMKKTEKLKFSRAELCKYIDYVQNNQLDKSKFVDIAPDDREFTNTDMNLIAFYLPQFHSFPANDDWFGKGFSEWTNATKTVPQYIGHYQPHLPYDVGFYNLETEHIFKRQIELAKMYGIKGFSFYYYWFSGKKIMEKPIQMFLKNKSLDMPFCMFWANENWSHLWGSGADEKILYKQEIVNGDAEKFMADILPYMKDERYIKIDNKPLLMIYNPEIYSKEILIAFIDKIRQIAKDNGFSDLYINTIMKPFMKKGEYKNYLNSIHFDGIVEFLPGCMHNLFNKVKKKVLNPLFKGNFLDVKEFVENKKYLYKTDARVFKGIFPMWDNSPRRCYRGATIFESSPQIYKKWLKDIIKWTKINNPKNEQYIFINAWNEWAEGAHLEPDQKYGYAYLQATKEALGEENS